jgi:hypothetical protein
MPARDYPGAAEFLPARRGLSQLQKGVQDCRGCDLYGDAAAPGGVVADLTVARQGVRQAPPAAS